MTCQSWVNHWISHELLLLSSIVRNWQVYSVPQWQSDSGLVSSDHCEKLTYSVPQSDSGLVSSDHCEKLTYSVPRSDSGLVSSVVKHRLVFTQSHSGLVSSVVRNWLTQTHSVLVSSVAGLTKSASYQSQCRNARLLFTATSRQLNFELTSFENNASNASFRVIQHCNINDVMCR